LSYHSQLEKEAFQVFCDVLQSHSIKIFTKILLLKLLHEIQIMKQKSEIILPHSPVCVLQTCGKHNAGLSVQFSEIHFDCFAEFAMFRNFEKIQNA